MHITDIIIKKRDGGKLSKAEIEYVTKEYTAGNIPDYQVSALLMAICIKGMDDEETENLTFAIRDSGDIVEFALDEIEQLPEKIIGLLQDEQNQLHEHLLYQKLLRA